MLFRSRADERVLQELNSGIHKIHGLDSGTFSGRAALANMDMTANRRFNLVDGHGYFTRVAKASA